MYNMYDEDNVDLEEQMYLQEVQDETDEDDPDFETEVEEDDDNYYEITKQFLNSQIKLLEPDRQKISYINKKTNKIYEGIVLSGHPNDKNKFMFSSAEIIDGIAGDVKTRIVTFSDIKKY